MRLPPLTIHRPSSLEEAAALRERLGGEAALYCGGTELLLAYKLGDVSSRHLIDVKGLARLQGISSCGGVLRIGAAVTHREIERSSVVQECLSPMATMERGVGNVRLRNTGTIGGNLCQADPRSELTTFLLAADGAVACWSRDTTRSIAIDEFVRGPFETALEPRELLVAVHVPELTPDTSIVHRKLSFRERPSITTTVKVRVAGDYIVEARLAVGSVGLVPILATEATDVLIGEDAHALKNSTLATVGESAATAVDPIEDADGSAEYKRQLVRVLTRRCVHDALGVAIS